MVAERTFRGDLFYRINVINLKLPPLRSRREDIMPIAASYLEHLRSRIRTPLKKFAPETEELLVSYDWPGNVRELEHIIVYGMSMVGENSNMLKFEDIEDKFCEMKSSVKKEAEEGDTLCPSLRDAVGEYERGIIARTMAVTAGNISEAAKILDVPRQTLQRKVKQYGILL